LVLKQSSRVQVIRESNRSQMMSNKTRPVETTQSQQEPLTKSLDGITNFLRPTQAPDSGSTSQGSQSGSASGTSDNSSGTTTDKK
jgi:hypothetical protein